MLRAPLLPLLLLAGGALGAQPSPQVAVATRVARAPRVDGRLDEAVWRNAQAVDRFTQQRPVPGKAATERTEVYFVYDDEALYVGARMHRVDPSAISRTMTRRDGFGNAERITITLDPAL